MIKVSMFRVPAKKRIRKFAIKGALEISCFLAPCYQVSGCSTMNISELKHLVENLSCSLYLSVTFFMFLVLCMSRCRNIASVSNPIQLQQFQNDDLHFYCLIHVFGNTCYTETRITNTITFYHSNKTR